MTAILGVPAAKGRILIGSDRCLTIGQKVTLCGPKAIWVGKWLVAVAGSIGGHWEGLAKKRPRTLESLLKAIGPGPYSEILVARGAKMWTAEWQDKEDRWSACEVHGPQSLGSGGEVALGAWLALADLPDNERMFKALQIASENCVGVGGSLDLSWT